MPYVVINPNKELGQKYGQTLKYEEGKIPEAIKFTAKWMTDYEVNASDVTETAELEAELKKAKSELAKVKKENKALTERIAELEGGNQEAK